MGGVAESDDLVQRVRALGLAVDVVPTDRFSSATAALLCFPMYMVAHVNVWKRVEKGPIQILEEAFAIGREEARLHIDPRHAEVLHALDDCEDRGVYDRALAALDLWLGRADSSVAEMARAKIADLMAKAALAAGKGLSGRGPRLSDDERLVIGQIAAALDLRDSPEAARILDAVLHSGSA